MNLFKYFVFYYRLLGIRFYIFLITAVSAAWIQGIAVAAFMAATSYGNEETKNANYVGRGIYFVIDWMGIHESNHQLLFLLCFCAITYFISATGLVGAIWYSAKLEAELMVGLQEKIVKKLFRAKYEYFLTHSIGFLNNVVVHEMSKVSSSYKFFSNIFINGMLVLSFMTVSIFSSLKITLLVVLIGLPMLLVFKKINSKIKDYSQRNVTEIGELCSIIYQILGHFKYLKATNMHHSARKNLSAQSKRYAYVIKMQALWGSICVEGLRPFVMTLLAGIVYFQVVYQGMGIGNSLVLMGVLYLAYQKSISVQGSYQKFLHTSGGILIYEKINHELNELIERDDFNEGEEPDFSKSIVFENVSFKYQGQKKNVIEDISLEIKPCSTVAFVGGSGAGKSTIVNLIAALFEPQIGCVKLNGQPYKNIKLEKLRSGFGYVTQEPVIFNDSVINNLTLWASDKKDAAIEAAQKAHADKFIRAMNNGYETVLGDDGLNISGGQRQRITISRELFRDTPMLILDEATSSLDTETEQLIQKSVDEAHGEKTIIIIAHRLSTVKTADCIFVLDEGRIVEQGAYDKLYEKNGRFRSMVDLQELA